MRSSLALLALMAAALWPSSLHSQATPPAARWGDYHVCPAVTGLQPHVGGPIYEGDYTVLICGQAAARVGDHAICIGPHDSIALGSSTVLIGGLPAARLGDATVHGGTILEGCQSVRIGG